MIEVAALLLMLAFAPQEGPPPSAVRVAPVERRAIAERQRVTGEVVAARRTRVATDEEALVVAVEVEEGDRVEAGAVLVRLDDRRLAIERRRILAEVAVADAVVRVREAEFAQSERDLVSVRGLDDRSAAQPKELADAESDQVVAEARLLAATTDADVARARLEYVEQRLANLVIRAPHAGAVVERLTEPGQWIGIGGAVVELLSTDAVEVWLDVPQRLAPHVLDPRARIHVEAGDGVLRADDLVPRTVPVVDSLARRFRVWVRVDAPPIGVLPGMSAAGWVPAGIEAEHLLVPRDALLRNDAGFFVYAARPGGPDGPALAMPVPVQLLFDAGGRVAVASPLLQDGDLVVIEGNERLFPQSPIRWTPPAAADAAKGA